MKFSALRRVWAGLLGGLALCLSVPVWAQAPATDGLVAVPTLTARVTDLTGTLDAGQRAALEQRLAAFETNKGAQIAVLLLPSTQPETIEQYGIRVMDAWKLGRKGVDDGVLLLVAKNDRRLRIEVGYGLEGSLNDATAKRIVSEVITPLFKAGDFAGGIQAGVEAILKVVDGEMLPAPTARPAGQGRGFPVEFLLVAAFFAAIGGAILRRIFGNLLGSSLVGGVGGLLGWSVLGGLGGILGGFLAGALLAVVGLDLLTSLALSGGRGGYGGGSGGGFGGFSGGGGMGGGGGASGSW